MFGHRDAEAGIVEQLDGKTPQFIDVFDVDACIGSLQQRRIDTRHSIQGCRIVATVFDVLPQHVRCWGKMRQLHGDYLKVCMEIYVKQLARVVKY